MPRGVYERTPEYRAKLSAALSGRTLSDEARRKVAQARTTHGLSRTSTYGIWNQMKQRCLNPNTAFYSRYGGRGITVCDRWMVFENFLADMGERPAGLTLERRDNDRGYDPGNCHWATPKEQANNRSYRVGGRHG